MSPEQTAKAYDSITHLWTRSDFNRENGVWAYQKALSILPSSFGCGMHYALDIGCGCTNRFIPILEKRGLVYEGVDISTGMLGIAQKAAPSHTFYCEDIVHFALPKQYCLISAWDSLWHIPLEQHNGLLAKLCANLPEGGVLLFSCGGVDEKGSHTNRAMGPEVYYASIGVNGYLSALIDAGCYIRHVEYDQLPEQHTVIIAQKGK